MLGDQSQKQIMQALMLPVFLALVGWLSFASTAPTEPAPMDAPADDFSATRAHEHVKIIAQKSHPMGTPEAREVRDYIVSELEALGFEIEIQATEIFYDYARFGRPAIMARVENIIARKAGTRGSGKDLVLMAHYDSRPQSLGASDDGAGVATILETVRALDNLPPLETDLMVLITDGEEMGLLGAQAFFHDSELASQVGLVLNFEARGSSGTVYMFETSVGNSALIEVMQRAAPRIFANAISYEVYSRMPNDTDLSISKEAGLQGLNFAYIEGFYDYHAPSDSAENMSTASLQHMGNYALGMSRALGHMTLPLPEGDDAVYFNLVGSMLVSYSLTSSWLVLLISIGTFGGAIFMARKKNVAHWLGVIRGLVAFSLVMVLLGLTISSLYGLISDADAGFVERWRLFAQANEQLTGFTLFTLGFLILTSGLIARGVTKIEVGALTITPALLLALGGNLGILSAAVLAGIAALLWFLFRQALPLWEQSLGALLFWAMAAIAIQFTAISASFFFAWPLLAAAIAHLYLLRKTGSEPSTFKSQAIILLGALLGIYWIFIFGYFVHQALGVFLPALTMVFIAIAAGLFMPALAYTGKGKARMIPVAISIIGLMVIVNVSLSRGFDQRERQPVELFYLLDGNSGESFWASGRRVIDPWTKQTLGASPLEANLSLLLPTVDNILWLTPAPSAPVASPEIQMISDSMSTGGRRLHFRVLAGGRGDALSLFFAPAGNILDAKVNGQTLTLPEAPDEWWRWRYYAVPDEGLEIEILMSGDGEARLHLTEINYFTPTAVASLVPEMPEDYMLMPYSFAGATVAIRDVRLEMLEGCGQ